MGEGPQPEVGTVLATYRIQLTPEFGFEAAAGIAAYLRALGVSHAYTSPYLQAAPGSTHGYDVVDHSQVSQDLGGERAHARMVRELRAAGLSQVIDVVPNHMAIGDQRNRWWWDVLENGASSLYAAWFDVDWNPPQRKLRNKILIPVLGDHYGRELEAGRIAVSREGASFVASYFEHRMPLAPRSLEEILAQASEQAGSLELESLGAAYGKLPEPTATDEASVYERRRDSVVLRSRLADLLEHSPQLGPVIDAALESICADPDRLDRLLEKQNWRLAYWRTGSYELDYRRFFDVDHLVALRVDADEVFEGTHSLMLSWVSGGDVTGLRIDHPDGLTDPEAYLTRLARRAPGSWLVVEKILEPGEQIPSSWPVAGTTGYDFSNLATGLLIDPRGEPELTELYREFTGERRDFKQIALAGKQTVLRQGLAAEVNRLATVFERVCERHRRHRDFVRPELAEVLREVLASFEVYRTYVRPNAEVQEGDVEQVERAVAAARRRRDDLDPELLAFLADLLLMRVPAPDDGENKYGWTPELELALRFQQLSGPVMAKGVEDTAFYNYNRFVALNEVGGDPARFGVSPEEFHRWCVEAQSLRPQGMLGTSTHDTKRSEDVRARLAVLSEIPQLWAQRVREWSQMNDPYREGVVDHNAEYLLYQVLAGAWPISVERAIAYAEKAAREAKAQTSWTEPNAEYDQALNSFTKRILSEGPFARDLESFVAAVEDFGRTNSLTQTLLKLTAPGVPDIYQGTELWDLSLVDPDNRRPVDFAARAQLLEELPGLSVAQVMQRLDEGLPKMLVVAKALELRRRRREAFGAESSYTPLAVEGEGAQHLVGFMRGDAVLSVVPRLIASRPADWGGRTRIQLPPGVWSDVFTGDRFAAGWCAGDRLLTDFPVALLERID